MESTLTDHQQQEFEMLQYKIKSIEEKIEELNKNPSKNIEEIMFYNSKLQSLMEEQSQYLY